MENELSQAAQRVESMLDRFTIDAVFAEPYREGNTVIVPVAEIGAMFGFGYGSGEGPAPAQQGAEGGTATGGGGGGGGRGSAKPRGVLKITPESVSYEPIMDPSRIGLAGIALVAWAVFWITLTVRAFAKK
jgi:uncharacterized spore protein YtfJ